MTYSAALTPSCVGNVCLRQEWNDDLSVLGCNLLLWRWGRKKKRKSPQHVALDPKINPNHVG